MSHGSVAWRLLERPDERGPGPVDFAMRCRWWPNEHGAVDGNAQGVLPHARRKEVLWAVFILILVRTGWAAT